MLKKIFKLLEINGITFQKMCSDLSFKETELEFAIESGTLKDKQKLQIAKYLKVELEQIELNFHDELLDKIKRKLASKNIPFSKMTSDLNLNNAALYRSFHNQTLSLTTLFRICKYLGVDQMYFFESAAISKLAEVVSHHSKSAVLKAFILEVNSDVSSGMPIEKAVFKAVAPDKYNQGLFQ